jgi:hypothetical protein
MQPNNVFLPSIDTEYITLFSQFYGKYKQFLETETQGRPLPMGQPGQSEHSAPPHTLKFATTTKNAKLCNIVIATSLLTNGGSIARLDV